MTQIAFYLFRDKFLWTGSNSRFDVDLETDWPTEHKLFPISGLFIVQLDLTLDLTLHLCKLLF